MLESVIEPVHHRDQIALRRALAQLAEQGGMINVRVDEHNHELTVSLYGEVQRGRAPSDASATSTASTSSCGRPHRSTSSGRVGWVRQSRCSLVPTTRSARRSGFEFRRVRPARGSSSHPRSTTEQVPLYIYRTTEQFTRAMEHYVIETLREGLSGWQVTDCAVTLVRSGYSSPDGPPSTNGPLSTAADFRKLTPMVLMSALDQAGTDVCAPMNRVTD